MICSKCKKEVFRAFSYYDENKIWHSEECEDCYPIGKATASMNSTTNKIRSRVLMPDGTVLTGQAGIRERDRRRKLQST